MGLRKRWQPPWCRPDGVQLAGRIDMLADIALRLKEVQIECLDGMDGACPFQREASYFPPVNRLRLKCDGGPRAGLVDLRKMDKLAQLTGSTCIC